MHSLRTRMCARHEASRTEGAAATRQRRLQVLLGLVWIADGALQLQPSMFTAGFVRGVLLPSAAGNPGVVAVPITTIGRFLEPHVAVWNAGFASLQLLLGIGLLVRRTVRPALAVSFVWSLAVWWLSEGLGGLLTGTASPLDGAPGAVLLYVVVGALAWPRRTAAADATAGSAASLGLLGGRGARVAWAVLWLGSAALLLQPANLHGGVLKSVVDGAASGEPGWLSRPLVDVAAALGPSGPTVTLVVASLMAAVGLGVALAWHDDVFLAGAVVLALAIWVLGEGLGGILTGSGTDPNTGPLLVLFAFGLRSGPTTSVRRPVTRFAPALPRLRGAH